MGPDGSSILDVGGMRSIRRSAGALQCWGRVQLNSGLPGWDEFCGKLAAMKGLHTVQKPRAGCRLSNMQMPWKGQLWASRMQTW